MIVVAGRLGVEMLKAPVTAIVKALLSVIWGWEESAT